MKNRIKLVNTFLPTEMLRTEAVQERIEVCQADLKQPKVPGAWGNIGNERPHPKLFGQKR